MYIYQPERDLLRQAMAKYAPELAGRILDIGAGESRYRPLFTSASEYVTADIDPNCKPDVVAGAEKLPFPDASFDVTVSNQVLGDVEHPEVAIREMVRVLRPGGLAILTEGMVGALHSEPRDYWRFTQHGLSLLFRQAGGEVVEAKLLGGLGSVCLQMWVTWCVDIFGLYRRPLIGWVASKVFFVLGKLAFALDALTTWTGWSKVGTNSVILARKPK